MNGIYLQGEKFSLKELGKEIQLYVEVINMMEKKETWDVKIGGGSGNVIWGCENRWFSSA